MGLGNSCKEIEREGAGAEAAERASPDCSHRHPVVRGAFVVGGWCALSVGAVGVVVPLLPTTPFILLAALLFSKGSPQLHGWLRQTRFAGRIIDDWEKHGMIRRETKIISTCLMLGLISYPIFFNDMAFGLKVVALLTMGGVLAFIWSRPSQPKGDLP